MSVVACHRARRGRDPVAGHDGGDYSDPASRTSLTFSHVLPFQRCNCIWVQTMLLVALVLILMPGSAVGCTKSFSDFACLMMLARKRSSPHCLSICSSNTPC